MGDRNLVSEQGLRLDGRRPGELRQIKCHMGVFTQADGSAYLQMGNTKVLVAIYGPHQVSNKNKNTQETAVINCQYSMATFSTGERKNRPRGDRKSEEMSIQLRQALSSTIKIELYPRSQIDIYFEVLQADGGNYCACVNAATLALIDAGIPITEYICACTASLANGDIPLIDITHLEETTGGPNLTVAALPSSGNIALLSMSQRFHIDHIPKVLETALKGCKDIQAILDRVVREHLAEVGSSIGWNAQSLPVL